jgi:ubiquitin-activating enzyme E1
MVDSGTLGSKGNTQVVVPRMTVHYGAERDQPPAQIALCTLKSFPYRIEHTIQWAKDWFDGHFSKIPANCNQYIKSKGQFIDSLDPNLKLRMLNGVLDFFTGVGATPDPIMGGYAKNFTDCIVWARLRFQQLFSNDIEQLTYNLPPEKVNENGTRFWSGTKRCPNSMQFNPEDPTHMAFVVSAANLHANSHGISTGRHTDETMFKKVLESVTVNVYDLNYTE